MNYNLIKEYIFEKYLEKTILFDPHNKTYIWNLTHNLLRPFASD